MQSATKRSNTEVTKLLDAAKNNNLRDAVDLIKNQGVNVDSQSRVRKISLVHFTMGKSSTYFPYILAIGNSSYTGIATWPPGHD